MKPGSLPSLYRLIPMAVLAAGVAAAQTTTEDVSGEIEEFVGIGGEDPNLVMPTQPLEGALGFSKSLVETPRSVSTVGSDLIDKIGIRDGDQLSRIVPGTYTVNRWGIAGATQVRGLPADTYLRGMKRIDPQGNIRNVITMWDNVEIVRGPPSPIFGNGRIGGYTNYTPKSVRGTTGKYLEAPTFSFTGVVASYDRKEAQFNYASPLKIGERDAGIQIFALSNDSDSYYVDNFQKDTVLQASFSWNMTDTWRMEAGGIYQKAVNAGQAGANRVDQSSFDDGTYLRGSALVNLDLDGDGLVSEGEIQASRSYTDYRGQRPLSIVFRVPLMRESTIVGVPRTLQDLLRRPEYATVAASPQGQAILAAPTAPPIQLYTSGVAGSPLSSFAGNQQIPAGFFLNPAELEYVERDWSLVAIEEKADGYTYTGYLDFISDREEDRTQKLQLFADYQYQEKESQLPFNQRQEIGVVEAKYTVTRRNDAVPLLNKLPDWVQLNLLGSVNVRATSVDREATSGDYDSRRDLVAGYRPTDTFTSYLRTGDTSFATGEPLSSVTVSDYIEYGGGILFDLTLWDRLGVLGGARYDYIDATSTDGERYNRTGNWSATNGSNTGQLLPERTAEGNDQALSRSVSVSYKLPWLGLTPYGTTARSSAALTGTALDIAYSNVLNGEILSEAVLDEYGVKGSLFDNKVFYSVSVFDQTRSGNVEIEGEGYIRSTRNYGTEVELRWLPNRHWSVILSGTYLKIYRVRLIPTQFRTALATAEYIGFQDVLDANGNVLVPANAFLWGGNPSVLIPNSDSRFDRYGQYPDRVFGMFVGYTWDNGFSASWSGNHVSSVAASTDLPDLLVLPSYFTQNVTLAWQDKSWRVSLQVRNVLDEEYFVPNNGSFGGTLLQAGLPRNWELSVTRRF